MAGTLAQAPVAELTVSSLPALDPNDRVGVAMPATAGFSAAPPTVIAVHAVAPARGVTVPWAPPM